VGLALCGLVILVVWSPVWDLFVSPLLPWNAGRPAGGLEREYEEWRARLDKECPPVKPPAPVPQRRDYASQDDYEQALMQYVDRAMDDYERDRTSPSCREP